MGRSKLERFQLNSERPNVVEPGKELYEKIKGNWSAFFKNDNSIILELGCGRGEYTTGLANLFPNKNFIGVDVKGSRIWKGSSLAYENQMLNVAFLRTYIQHLDTFFNQGEVEDIWITFPDPRPKINEEKRRITNLKFMHLYKYLLKENGMLFFKTDNDELFDYTLEVLQNPILKVKKLVVTKDLYNSTLLVENYNLQTTFEKKYFDSGKTINYLKCSFNADAL